MRNPLWTRDELILALDLYIRFDGNPPGKKSTEVMELSRLLNTMGRSISGRNKNYRNPNGVYMKVMNFRRFDSVYANSGRVGLRRGNKDEKEVWRDFASNQDKLRRTVAAIVAAVNDGDSTAVSADDDQFVVAEEGDLLTSLHKRRERSRSLVEKKKALALAEHGKIVCEACGFDFEAVYGVRGQGFIEAHHTRPVHTLRPKSKTKLVDLALLCANCHRMVHSKRPWLTLAELRQLLSRTAARGVTGSVS